MYQEHFCSTVRVAERTANFPVGCAWKDECYGGIRCPLVRRHGSWHGLLRYFTGLAYKTRAVEKALIEKPIEPDQK
jgi:hypothetical protein